METLQFWLPTLDFSSTKSGAFYAHGIPPVPEATDSAIAVGPFAGHGRVSTMIEHRVLEWLGKPTDPMQEAGRHFQQLLH